MDTKGLYLGIDIGEHISRVCRYDPKGRSVTEVSTKEGSTCFQNNIPLSRIFENRETAVARLSSMLKALIAAAADQAGEERVSMAGLCLHDYSEDSRRLWREALHDAGLDPGRYILMGREETFAYYAFSSDPGTYTRGVVLYELEDEGLRGCFLQRVTYKGLTLLTESDESETSDTVRKAGSGELPLNGALQEICAFLKKTLDKNTVSSVYLTGAAFDTEELPEEILSTLGRRGHRIFAGMNLYVKGACIGALAKNIYTADPFRSAGIYKNVSLSGGAAGLGNAAHCVMACKNRISSEVYVVERVRGELKGRLLIERGANVDDACKIYELILGERGEIQLEVVPLTQNTPDIYVIAPETKADPAKELVRVQLELYFPDEDRLMVTVRGINGSYTEESHEINLMGTGKQTVRTRSDGIIFCEKPLAREPYRFPATGDEIYSVEELVRYLYENVYLTGAEGGFVNDGLFKFLREQTASPEIADKLETVRKGGGSDKELLLTLFREVNYYSPQEIVIIEPVIDSLKTGKRALVKYGRAEAFIKRSCLSKAAKELQEIMELNPDSELPESFYAKVLYNAGVCYARCLMYEKAAQMFEGSYGFVKDEATKSAALLTRRLSGTEPAILYMKGEWEQAGVKAEELRQTGDGSLSGFDERLDKVKEAYLRKYS